MSVSSHGTRCAGEIAAARDNNICGVGVASCGSGVVPVVRQRTIVVVEVAGQVELHGAAENSN